MCGSVQWRMWIFGHQIQSLFCLEQQEKEEESTSVKYRSHLASSWKKTLYDICAIEPRKCSVEKYKMLDSKIAAR